ncbi:MAG: HNH endonuclease, partial [Nanoarchaeota archaeon]
HYKNGLKGFKKGHKSWTSGLTKGNGYPDKIGFQKNNKIQAKEKHWHWKGGITPIYLQIRASGKYKEWRKDVFKRDNYTCQICGKKGCYLEADHIKSFAQFPELRFDLNNGRTLCQPCHKEVTFK